MTAAEANAFLDTGSLPSSATADAYLNQYLPYDFLLKGFVVGYLRDGMTATTDPTGLDAASLTLRADGTGSKNGGLFTRRTLREIVYGYEDPLLELLGEASYAGALNAYDDGALRLQDRQAPHERRGQVRAVAGHDGCRGHWAPQGAGEAVF